MPVCQICSEEVDEVVSIQASGKRKKACEDCAEELAGEQEVLEESEAVVQQMMGFKGRR